MHRWVTVGLLVTAACGTRDGSALGSDGTAGLEAGETAFGDGDGGAVSADAGDEGAEAGDATAGEPRLDVIPNDCPTGDCRPACEPEFEAFLDPVVKCSAAESGSGVMRTPVVIDLEGDGTVEIVFAELDGSLRAIRGSDCSEVFHRTDGPVIGLTDPIAAADVDGDGDAEIFATTDDRAVIGTDTELIAFDHTGQTITTANSRYVGAAAIADIDGQSPAEIIVGGNAFRLEGSTLTKLWEVEPARNTGFLRDRIPAVADVDLDGALEVVFDNTIVDARTGAVDGITPGDATDFAWSAIAQIDFDTPEPEIIAIARSEELRVYHPVTGNRVMGLDPLSLEGGGGPPTVADFDGDDRPEIGFAAQDAYVLFDPDCDVEPLPAECESRGVRWRSPITETSSGVTGSTPFDFNGDGHVEVAYRDECWLRVYSGATGEVLSAFPLSSNTWLENPVVADIDGDGHAELVMTSDDINAPTIGECPDELGRPHPKTTTKGIFVLEDPEDRWVPTRAIWNQHTYHVTNINEDGTVPEHEPNNWDVWNNYRQNVWPEPTGPCKPVEVG